MRSTAPDAAAAAFARLAFDRLPLVCLAAAAVAGGVAGPGWSERLAALPWIMSLVFVGLPHGAADFALSRRLCRGWNLAGLWLAYAAIMAAVAGGFLAAPVAALAVFVALSGWHFGTADADLDRPPPTGWARGLTAIARGYPVVAMPLLAHPAATAAAANELLRLALPTDGLMTTADVRWAGFVLAAAAMLAAVGEGLLASRGPGGMRRWLEHLGALAVILAVGLFTAPMFAVGMYFLVWHAWRQMGPLAAEVTGSPPTAWRELVGALIAIHEAALPLLVPAWVALAAAWWIWSPEHDPRDLAILSIAAYLVVTPAHELLGEILRRVQPA